MIKKEDAENIIRDYLNGWVEWRNDGLFIQQGMVENDPTGSVFHWTPAYNMEWDGAPDPTTAPSLPFPFTANQLAAFMLNGIGTGVAAAYGTWEHGPDEAAMDEAMGIRARRAREALRKAFSLYREAEKVVGELAPEVWNECLPIHPSILRVQGNKLALQATLKHLSWCRAMTRQLLQPQATTPSPAPVLAVGASGNVERVRAKRRTWRDVAWPYMVEVVKAGQYKTGKEFYQALKSKAGTADSPFDRGTGHHRDVLFVREISETLALKTIQTHAWKELKASRQTG